MKPHHQLTIVRNRYRARELRVFRDLVETYFDSAQRDPDDVPFDWAGAQAARSKINQMLPRVIHVVRSAGLGGPGASVPVTDPGPALGQVDALQRIFTAPYADGVEQEILDLLDMAIGVYDGGRAVALARTFNPLHYVGTALAFVARGPRRVLAALGLRGRAGPRVGPADMARLEAVAARLMDVDELIESRLATLRDRQALRNAEHTRQLAELAERLDFAERVLAQRRPPDRLGAAEDSDLTTPV